MMTASNGFGRTQERPSPSLANEPASPALVDALECIAGMTTMPSREWKERWPAWEARREEIGRECRKAGRDVLPALSTEIAKAALAKASEDGSQTPVASDGEAQRSGATEQ